MDRRSVPFGPTTEGEQIMVFEITLFLFVATMLGIAYMSSRPLRDEK